MNVFLTGCDSNTEWQLPWFIDNFRRYNSNAKIILADFGISKSMLSSMESYFDKIIPSKKNVHPWFKKPMTIEIVAKDTDKVCWIDTDCEIKGNIESIFELSNPNKLSMVEDRPWTKRRNTLGKWYNAGVVLVEGCPSILSKWTKECAANPVESDQHVLYVMTGADNAKWHAENDVKRLTYINPLPHTYNTLRLDYIDDIAVKDPKIIHHTGVEGNNKIKSML